MGYLFQKFRFQLQNIERRWPHKNSVKNKKRDILNTQVSEIKNSNNTDGVHQIQE